MDASKEAYQEGLKTFEQLNQKAKDLILLSGAILGLNIYSTATNYSIFFIFAMIALSISVFVSISTLRPQKAALVAGVNNLSEKKLKKINYANALAIANNDYLACFKINKQKTNERSERIDIAIFLLGLGVVLIIIANIDIIYGVQIWKIMTEIATQTICQKIKIV